MVELTKDGTAALICDLQTNWLYRQKWHEIKIAWIPYSNLLNNSVTQIIVAGCNKDP